MKHQVETLVIVGAGTAGWMAASLLKARFGSSLSVTVVESDRVPTIGVGEASLPVLRDFLRALRVDEGALLKACDASLKAGLRFAGWRTNEPDDVYYHLFFGGERSEPLLQLLDGLQTDAEAPKEAWRGLMERGVVDGRGFMKALTLAGQLIAQRKASKRDADAPYESPLGYAYHLDAKLFADFLRDWCVARGVRHLRDHVTQVDVAESGDIRSVTTEKQGVIAGGFFVDCTGFRGVLINETLQEPFEPYRPWLLCDSAVAIQLPYGREDHDVPSHTCLDALSAGWSWRIPLFSRVGSGYVYSREFVTPEEAEAELRARLGPGAEGSRAHHLRMRVGRNRRSWVNNCLSVGLSAGFLEALESTSIGFIQRGIAKFLVHFRDRRFDPQGRDRYNREMGEDFEECRDFLVIHYCLSERQDTPFWRECHHTVIPDRVTALLDEWRRVGSLRRFVEGEGVGRFFPAVSWYSILLGMDPQSAGRRPGKPAAAIDSTAAWLSQWQSTLAQVAEEFPDHRRFLAGLRAKPAQARPARSESVSLSPP